MTARNLAELQRRFKGALESGGGREAALALGIRDTTGVPIERRLGIYEYAYWARQEEALAEDFPELLAKVGKRKASALLRAYLTAFPSRYPSLAELGQDMERFLREAAPWSSRPALAELARLEWLRVESLAAPEVLPASPERWSRLDAERLDEVIFVADPSLAIYESGTKRRVLTRRNGEVVEDIVNPAQLSVLRSITGGNQVADWLPSLEDSGLSAETVMGWAFSWVARGWIVDFTQPSA